MPDLLLRGGRAGLGGRRADILVRDGRIADVVPAGTLEETGGEVVTLPDATVLPGFVDAHVHVDQWVHASHRVNVRQARSAEDVVGLLRAHLEAGTPTRARVLTGHGFVDGLWTTPMHRRSLDAAFGDLPVAVVSSDLHALWLNGAALAIVERRDHPTGVLREAECMTALRRLMDAESDEVVDGWVAESLATAATKGVTGLVDFEFADNLTTWTRRAARGRLDARVSAAVWLPWLDQAIALGRRSGDPLAADGSAVVGPFKLVVDGSLNTRTAYCHDAYAQATGEERFGLQTLPFDELVHHLARASDAGLLPAVHAIGDAANTAALDAFEKVGCTGRIEHAQLVRDEDLPRFASAGVIASVQPQHAVADRDVADHHWRGRTGRAFPYAALHAAGADLRFGSDAPVSPVDPWDCIAAAMSRTDDARPAWHPEQSVPLEVALAAACDGRERLVPGDVADLTVVAGDPSGAAAEDLRDTSVLLTLRGGCTTHRAC